jgi:hypothetical protein
VLNSEVVGIAVDMAVSKAVEKHRTVGDRTLVDYSVLAESKMSERMNWCIQTLDLQQLTASVDGKQTVHFSYDDPV